ncbi:hypothetical protein A6U89_33640 [Agrobacterium sp. B133/95]|nr:hypothetical protein A6U89_33640 [Agrobacterium sp. B133/95]
MRAPEIRPVRDSYRIDTASKTGIRSFIDRCNNAGRMAIPRETEIRRIQMKRVSGAKIMYMIGPAVVMKTVAREERRKTVTHRSPAAQTSDDQECGNERNCMEK